MEIANNANDQNHPPELGDLLYLIFASDCIFRSYLNCGPNHDDGVSQTVNTNECESTEQGGFHRILGVVGKGADEDISHNKEQVVDADRNASRVEITAALFCDLSSRYYHCDDCCQQHKV